MQLEKVSLSRLLVEGVKAKGVRPPTQAKDGMTTSFTIHPKKGRRRFGLDFELNVSLLSHPQIRHISFDGEMLFRLPEDMSDEAVRVYVPTVLLSSAIGLARGIIAQATSTCESGPYWLPYVDVRSLVRSETKKSETPLKPTKKVRRERKA